MCYVYILECNDKTLYTGWTNNLENRLKTHLSGKGAKYTRGRLPVRIVYYEMFDNKSEALKREYKIKRLNREEKIKIILNQEQKIKTIETVTDKI